ncbi:sulfur carrier protein ThiS [Roseburia sp. MSJ-14]|uniref:sulfur carrier protein ThiS n=1 Tax=Roseburia sp. MSJ-14 TaxID=2841514 RepID=UPI001C0FAB71|nr:sulfur carrier protein ThiS [Roseburia sp. MSJ-14]MBU5473090.1 sulfur carrier protein ThiS [Roseburia sp. MSJ-14]
MIINGIEKEYPVGITLSEVLAKEGYQPEQIAVECNEEIVPKAEYQTYILNDADQLEVVKFMGGG